MTARCRGEVLYLTIIMLYGMIVPITKEVTDIMTTEYTFTTRLAALLAVDVVLTAVNAYIPHELTAIRTLVALVQLAFMAATMAMAIKRMLEDY
jgi:hypothetical protein